MTRLEALENVAYAARQVRNLERTQPLEPERQLTGKRLAEARQVLDEALQDLERTESRVN